MPLEVKLQLKTAQKLVMTAMLQQAIKLLPLSRLELVQKVHQEMLENPFLEDALAQDEGTTDVADEGLVQDTEEVAPPELDVDWEAYLQDSGGDPSFPADMGKEIPSLEATLKNETSLTDYLLWQLSLATHDEVDKEVGAYLIGNIDDNGYLQGTLEEIAEATRSEVERVERMLEVVQSFDPSGIGARDLQECLLLQLSHLGMADSLAGRIIEGYLERLDERFFQRMARELGVTLEEVIAGVKLIREPRSPTGRPVQCQPR